MHFYNVCTKIKCYGDVIRPKDISDKEVTAGRDKHFSKTFGGHCSHLNA